MTLAVVLLVCAAVLSAALWLAYTAIQQRRRTPKPLPSYEGTRDAYKRALRKWQRDYARGKDKRPDFPTHEQWVAEQQMAYYEKHGVWPWEKNP